MWVLSFLHVWSFSGSANLKPRQEGNAGAQESESQARFWAFLSDDMKELCI